MKKEKQYLLDEIKSQLQHSPSFLLAQYTALDANKANEFRKELNKVGGTLEIIKKRVFVKAAEEIGTVFAIDSLTGHVGLILANENPVEVTKSIMKYSEENNSLFNLIGGFVEGSVLGAADIQKLATLPSKAEMQAQFLGLLEAPMAGTLSVMESVMTSVMHCMNNRDQK